MPAGGVVFRRAAGGSAAKRGSWTLVATGLGLFMIFLDAMIVNVAIPDIQREFGAGETASSGSSPRTA